MKNVELRDRVQKELAADLGGNELKISRMHVSRAIVGNRISRPRRKNGHYVYTEKHVDELAEHIRRNSTRFLKAKVESLTAKTK